jgi:hypothetical protein
MIRGLPKRHCVVTSGKRPGVRRFWKRLTAKYWRRRAAEQLDEAPKRQVQRWWS